MPQRKVRTDEHDDAAMHFMGADELAQLAIDDSSDCLAMWASVGHEHHPGSIDGDSGASGRDRGGDTRAEGVHSAARPSDHHDASAEADDAHAFHSGPANATLTAWDQSLRSVPIELHVRKGQRLQVFFFEGRVGEGRLVRLLCCRPSVCACVDGTDDMHACLCASV